MMNFEQVFLITSRGEAFFVEVEFQSREGRHHRYNIILGNSFWNIHDSIFFYQQLLYKDERNLTQRII